jgi:hypothetical protein
VRGKARLVAGAVWVAVAESFELFFRLMGSTTDRVQVELFHGSPRFDVTPCVPDARFAVAAERGPSTPPPLPAPIGAASKAPAAPPMAWLLDLPEGGERQVFEHLAAHGTVTEEEAAAMLGGPRAARRFALRFEEFARKAPFGVRIDVVAGAKRYVREGNNS